MLRPLRALLGRTVADVAVAVGAVLGLLPLHELDGHAVLTGVREVAQGVVARAARALHVVIVVVVPHVHVVLQRRRRSSGLEHLVLLHGRCLHRGRQRCGQLLLGCLASVGRRGLGLPLAEGLGAGAVLAVRHIRERRARGGRRRAQVDGDLRASATVVHGSWSSASSSAYRRAWRGYQVDENLLRRHFERQPTPVGVAFVSLTLGFLSVGANKNLGAARHRSAAGAPAPLVLCVRRENR